MLPFTLNPDQSELHADEREGDIYCSHPAHLKWNRAGQLIVHLFVGYIYWALTLSCASRGLEMLKWRPVSELYRGKRGHNDHSSGGLVAKTVVWLNTVVWEPRGRAALFLGESEGFIEDFEAGP